MANIKTKKQNTIAFVLFAIYLLALVWLVLFKLQFSVPVMEEGRVINLIPLLGSLDAGGVIDFGEIRNNILAFIPLGVYLCLLKGNGAFVKKALAALMVTVGFETIQFVFAIGRADITDVLSNTLGGVIGLGVYALLRKFLKGRTNQVLLIVAAAVTICAVALVAVLTANHRWIRIR